MKKKIKAATWVLDAMDVPSAKPYFLKYLQATQEAGEAERKAEYFRALYEAQMDIHSAREDK